MKMENEVSVAPVQPPVTVDTPEFMDAANNWIGLMFEAVKPGADHIKMAAALTTASASFIAHIDNWHQTTQAAAVEAAVSIYRDKYLALEKRLEDMTLAANKCINDAMASAQQHAQAELSDEQLESIRHSAELLRLEGYQQQSDDLHAILAASQQPAAAPADSRANGNVVFKLPNQPDLSAPSPVMQHAADAINNELHRAVAAAPAVHVQDERAAYEAAVTLRYPMPSNPTELVNKQPIRNAYRAGWDDRAALTKGQK